MSGFPVDAFARMTRGRYVSLPRGELAASIFGKIEGKVETIFGNSVEGIEQTERSVQVTLASGGMREFDLVVGADGLHSRVRELVFGEESHFEKYLGYKAGAFAVEGYRPRDELGLCDVHASGPASGEVGHARRPHDVPVYVCG